MREHMDARWIGLEDQEWFNDMTQYMEEHWTEVQNLPWFIQMLKYMESTGISAMETMTSTTVLGSPEALVAGAGKIHFLLN